MLFANNKFARSSLFMLLIGAGLLVAIVLSSFFLAGMTRTYFDEVTKLRAVRSVAADMLVLLNSAESSQRGYLLVQNEAFLEPYQKALEALPSQVERLERVSKNQNTVNVPLEDIRRLIAEKVTEMQSTLNLASEGKVADAVAIVRNESGFVVMQQLRQAIGDVVQELDGHLINGIGEIRESAGSLQYVTLGGGLLISAEKGLFFAREQDGKVAIAPAGDAAIGPALGGGIHQLPAGGTLIGASRGGWFGAREQGGKVTLTPAGNADTGRVALMRELAGKLLIGAEKGLFVAGPAPAPTTVPITCAICARGCTR